MISADNRFNAPNETTGVLPKKKKKRTKKKKVVTTSHYSDSSSDSEDELQFLGGSSSVAVASSSKSTDSGLSNVAVSSYEGNHMNDPVALTIDIVISRSDFSRECVTTCINRMWDEGLKYDDPDAVLRELRAEEDSRVRGRDDYDELLDGKVDIPARKQPPLSGLPGPAVKVEHKKSKPMVPAAPRATQADAAEKLRGEDNPVTADNSHNMRDAKENLPTAVETTLSARLETTAAHSDISEAILALVSWCKIVGDAAPGHFFQDDCHALEILLQALCEQPGRIHQEEVRVRLAELLALVLPLPTVSASSACAVSAESISSLVRAIESVLSKVDAARALKPSTPARSTAPGKGSSSKFCPLALRMAATLRTVHQIYEKERQRVVENGAIYALDDEIQDVSTAAQKVTDTLATSAVDKPGAHIKEKFELRELQHEILQLHLKKHEAIVAKQRMPPCLTKEDPSVSSSPADYQTLENAIFSSSGDSRRHIDTLKMQSSSSRSFYEKIFSDHEARVAPFKAKLEQCNQSWTALQQQHHYLKQQLLSVEAEMTAEQNRSSALMSTLGNMQAEHEKALGAMNSSQSHVLEAMEKDKQMTALIASVKGLEQVADDVVVTGLHSGGTRSGGAPSPRVPSVSPETLISGFLAYATSESSCVDVLSKRVRLMKEKRTHLQREVGEYKNLGMQSLAAEITQSIDRLEVNTAEDVGTLGALQDSVCSALAQLHSVIRNPSLIRSMPYNSLREIASALSTAGVAVRPELTPYTQLPCEAAEEKPAAAAPPPTLPRAPIPADAKYNSENILSKEEAPLPQRTKTRGTTGSKVTQPVPVTPPPGLSDSPSRASAEPAAPPAKPAWGGWGISASSGAKAVRSLADIQAEQERSTKASGIAFTDEEKADSSKTSEHDAANEESHINGSVGTNGIVQEQETELEEGEIRE